MSKRRLVITAVLAGRSQSEVARTYGVSQGWVSRLMARHRAEGEAAFEPLSRAPKSSPGSTPPQAVELVLRLRKQLDEAGLDAGADTIGWHLNHGHHISLSRATINRILVRAGVVVPDPSKRPKSSYIRFEAETPNECWQSDFTHYRLVDGTEAEILTWLDDCSRCALSVTAHVRVTGPIVLAEFRKAVAAHGVPVSTLTDNGMVFTTRFSGGKGGRNHHQQRPHRSLPHQATPATVYTSLPKATPTTDRSADTHHRVRHDKIDKAGSVTLRVAGRLRHIGVGRTYARTDVILLVRDLHVRIVDAATGELLRDLIIDPRRDSQPTGRPPGPHRTSNSPNLHIAGPGHSDVPRHHTSSGGRI
jgi:transposase InsO family protein